MTHTVCDGEVNWDKWGHTRHCERKATITEGGLVWCAWHAPSRVLARSEAATQRSDERLRASSRVQRINDAAPDMLDVLRVLVIKVDAYRKGYGHMGADLIIALESARAILARIDRI